jgi:hypothetical protein
MPNNPTAPSPPIDPDTIVCDSPGGVIVRITDADGRVVGHSHRSFAPYTGRVFAATTAALDMGYSRAPKAWKR